MKNDQNEFNSDYLEDASTLQHVNEIIGYIILEFGAPWCTHCQLAQPLVQEVLAGHPELTHIKLYDGKGKPLGRAFNVKLWPTLILLRDGKEIERLIRPLCVDDIRHLVMQSK
ncbi:MAG: thioredoxin 1 [Oleiphilaceae bacterium]|jgi:thioredoxin 1